MFQQPKLYDIPESPTRYMVMADIWQEKWPALEALHEELTITTNLMEGTLNKGPRHYQRQRYLCIGCQITDGHVREDLLEFAMYPLYAKAAEILFRTQFVLQAYHPQAYEPEANPGPGGVIGIQPVMRNMLSMADDRASTAYKMELWVDKATNYAYLDDPEAEEALWTLLEERCAGGIAFIKGLNDVEPEIPAFYPDKLRHEMHMLLGIAASRKLVEQQLGKRLVLIDRHRLIGTRHLRWEHFYQ